MIVQSRAIILKTISYQESSKILTVLSSEHGKIAVIAKGAKKPKSKLAGVLETGNILDLVYYYKAGRSVQVLKEASIHHSSHKILREMERAAILYASLELLNQLVHENEVNLPVFEFAQNFIPWLSSETEVNASVFVYAQIRLAEINGIGLRNHLNSSAESVFLNISSGNISEHSESELAYKLSASQAAFIARALAGKSKRIFELNLENEELKQLVRHIDVYFKYHIDGYQERKSDAVFEQMLQM